MASKHRPSRTFILAQRLHEVGQGQASIAGWGSEAAFSRCSRNVVRSSTALRAVLFPAAA